MQQQAFGAGDKACNVTTERTRSNAPQGGGAKDVVVTVFRRTDGVFPVVLRENSSIHLRIRLQCVKCPNDFHYTPLREHYQRSHQLCIPYGDHNNYIIPYSVALITIIFIMFFYYDGVSMVLQYKKKTV